MRKLLYIIFCFFVFGGSLHSKEVKLSKDWYKIFFTHPCPSGLNDPESALTNLIDFSQISFYGSFYDISSPKIIKALIRARKRGVEIKLVLESNNFHRSGIYQLYKQKIPIVTDNRNGLMHNKFAVIDQQIVWTGSYNATKNGNKNNNNAIIIKSKECADIYANEFFEQFDHKVFGNKRDYGPFINQRKKNRIKINNTDVFVYFAPEDPIENKIINLLRSAKHSVHFMAYSFTSDRLGEELIKLKKRGITIKGIFEKRGIRSEFSQFYKLKVSGIPVVINKNKYLMHHKVFIIDNRIVVTGSYNFSNNASAVNDENIIVIVNSTVAKIYQKEFQRLFR